MISSENYRYQLAVLRYRRYLVLSHNYHHYKPNSLPVTDATRLDVADDALRVSTAALPSCLPFRYASHNATMILLPPTKRLVRLYPVVQDQEQQIATGRITDRIEHGAVCSARR